MGDFQGQTVNLPEGNPVISLLSPMSIHPSRLQGLTAHPSFRVRRGGAGTIECHQQPPTAAQQDLHPGASWEPRWHKWSPTWDMNWSYTKRHLVHMLHIYIYTWATLVQLSSCMYIYIYTHLGELSMNYWSYIPSETHIQALIWKGINQQMKGNKPTNNGDKTNEHGDVIKDNWGFGASRARTLSTTGILQTGSRREWM